MDPEQVRAEMKATRRRIDEKLDLLQARMAAQKGLVTRAALGGGALVSGLYMWSRLRAKLRARRQRKYAREHMLARAQGW